MSGTVHLNGHVFRLEQEMTEATSMFAPNPTWSFLDANGHMHRWVNGKLPTVKTVTTGEYWCSDCCEMHDESESRCVECEAVIDLKGSTIANETRQYVPGLRRLFVDGESVTLDEFKQKWVEFGGKSEDVAKL